MGVYVRDLLLGLVSQKLLYYMVKFSCFLCNYYSPMENLDGQTWMHLGLKIYFTILAI